MGYDKGYETASEEGLLPIRKGSPEPYPFLSDLTEAIITGQTVDWAALNGSEAWIIHGELGVLRNTLHRNTDHPEDTLRGWFTPGSEYKLWEVALRDAWFGDESTRLYIRGDIPLRRTANQLTPGEVVTIRSLDTEQTWEYAICVAPNRIAVAENNQPKILNKYLDHIEVIKHHQTIKDLA